MKPSRLKNQQRFSNAYRGAGEDKREVWE